MLEQVIIEERKMIQEHIENLSTESLAKLFAEAEVFLTDDKDLQKDSKLRQMLLSLGLRDSYGHLEFASELICLNLAKRFIRQLEVS